MDTKYIAIFIAVLFLILFGFSAYGVKTDNDCKIYGMTMGYSPEKIIDICK